MNWYFKLLANHPCTIICTVGAFSIVALVVSLTGSKLPNFSDPQLGFETRGTEIAKRLTTWENLYEATRPSGVLTVNPLSHHLSSENVSFGAGSEYSSNDNHYRKRTELAKNISLPELEDTPKVETDENFDEDWMSPHGKEKEDYNHDHDHLSSDGFFCDGLSPDYSHIVLEAIDNSQTLLSLDALNSICIIQQRLMNNDVMSSICQTISAGHCCNPWSLPNYITLLLNHTSCADLTEKDIQEVKTLLLDCVKYYNNLKLRPDCHEQSLCPGVPSKCTKFNAVYNILYYLTDVDFLSTNYSHSDNSNLFLNHTMIFLPIARSSAILPYYYNLSSSSMHHGNVHVVAMDLGLKNALFNDCLIRDAFLMIAGGGFMVLCIFSYTNSFFITISTVLAIIMSLLCSYFVYTFFFKIKFFPFMNLLAIVVAIGIGADDAFIFYKIWECFKIDKMNSSVVKLVSDTLRHSSVSMFVTSLTTAAAFYSSYISSITAINCFSVFAGTAVLVNFVLMVTWLPACFVVSQKTCCATSLPQCRPDINNRIRTARQHTHQMKVLLDRCLILTIVRLKWLWLFLFASIAIGSAVVVLYYPKLKLPDSKNFHLFQSSHLFERYDSKYREKFWFERLEKVSGWDNTNFKLPLRFLWGILPVDNGNYLEPDSKGTLEFDSTFDMTAPESQVWLLNFCRLLRTQSFYQSTLGPLLPNCFIESFKNWMQRRCRDVIDDIDRSPCCESSKFPFSPEIFKKCIVEAMANLYETPADYFLPGVAGPKFSKTNQIEIRAIVVEYDSNHSYSMSFKDMHEFYTEVETWFQEQLSNAPPGMKNGWFVSHLGFYDLQLSLSNGTAVAIGVSMAISLAVFFFVSLNILISIYTIVTISFVIFVTVALLILMGWRLNVLESVAVTTAIGLAVDFSLHYGMTYRVSAENCRESAVEFTLTRMGGPTLMAALTTGATGFFMLPSSVLAYIQIGVFLIVVMSSSWLYSTIFLMSLLSLAGPRRSFGQFSYKCLFLFCKEKNINSPAPSNKTMYTNVLSDSVLSTSSITEGSVGTHLNENEAHELEALTRFSNNRIQCSSSSKPARKKQFSPN